MGEAGVDCELHPLIHSLLKFTLSQDVEKKKAEPRTPHFLSSNQDVVANQKYQECELKYVINSMPLSFRHGNLSIYW
jgi:hypothetical protein